MIDIENEIFSTVSKAVRKEYSTIYLTIEPAGNEGGDCTYSPVK